MVYNHSILIRGESIVWWRGVVFLVALAGACEASAQTLGFGVKLPVELANFTTANLTDNWEIFGQLRVGAFALESGVFIPLVPLVASAHLKFDLSRVGGMVLFLGGGGFLISIGEETFTGVVGKAGLEWVLPGLPLKALFEGGWQSSIEMLQGSGGPFIAIGVRWDL